MFSNSKMYRHSQPVCLCDHFALDILSSYSPNILYFYFKYFVFSTQHDLNFLEGTSLYVSADLNSHFL